MYSRISYGPSQNSDSQYIRRKSVSFENENSFETDTLKSSNSVLSKDDLIFIGLIRYQFES